MPPMIIRWFFTCRRTVFFRRVAVVTFVVSCFVGADGDLGVSTAQAQVAPTTVQLPTTEQFTVGTTVWVPDGGSALLGGVNSWHSGSSSRGVPMLGRLPGIGRAFNNQAFGAIANTAQSRVHVTVHDLEAMDAALRSEPAARRVRREMGIALEGDDWWGDGAALGAGGMYPVGSLDGSLVRGSSPETAVSRRARRLSQHVGRGQSDASRRDQSALRSSTDPDRFGGVKNDGGSVPRRTINPHSCEPPLVLRGPGRAQRDPNKSAPAKSSQPVDDRASGTPALKRESSGPVSPVSPVPPGPSRR